MTDANVITLLKTAVPWLLLLLGLAFSVVIDPYIDRRRRTLILIINGLTLVLLLQQAAEYLISTGRACDTVRFYTSALGYSIRPVLLILFLKILHPEKDQRLFWILAALNAALYLTSDFTGLAFAITNNRFHRLPLGNACLFLSIFLLLILTVQSVLELRNRRRLETWLPVANCLLIMAAAAEDIFSRLPYPVSYLTMAIIGCSISYYIWLHLRFVREHERDLMAEQRIRIMVSQIQPHFLYNTIATIKALCRRDPAKAEIVAEKFGRYLRQNLETLESEGLIPFEKELEHTRLYADIEMVRFENVRVEYEIEDRDFALPPLTLQPMVENAIRHGVRIRPEGVVRVCSRKAGGCHEITIRDNGVGFDADALQEGEGSHIGIRNVRERIERQCGGTLTLDSRAGEGTTVTIRIPQGREAP